jgi:hypothetical protein
MLKAVNSFNFTEVNSLTVNITQTSHQAFF